MTIQDGIIEVLTKAAPEPLSAKEIVKRLQRRKAFAAYPRKSFDGILSDFGRATDGPVERVGRGVYRVRPAKKTRRKVAA